jgi:cation:H+ antiporter
MNWVEGLTTSVVVPAFLASVAITLAAAALFADRLDHIGPRVGMPESLTGLLTAVAADGPEVSSALIALVGGHGAVGVGVVLGSNAFNLAAMIGVSAILTGVVRLQRRALAIEGTVAVLVTLIGAGVIEGALSAPVAMIGLAAVLVPYVMVIGRGAGAAAHEVAVHPEATLDEPDLWKPIALAIGAVALIILGSFGMVDSAVTLAHRWGVSASIVGGLLLAVITSLPNAFTAVRLGLRHRGTALVSETLNSNTINLAFGVVLPALFLSLGAASGTVDFDLAWLLLMTSVAIGFLARPRGMARGGGWLLVGLYVAFAVVELATA